MDKHIIKTKVIKDYSVLTDSGFNDIKALHETIPYEVYKLTLSDGNQLKCADNHIVFYLDDFEEVYVKNLKVGDKIIVNGDEKVEEAEVIEILNLGYAEPMYDLELAQDSNKRYYTNEILSHNTQYIRVLLKELSKINKSILYAPPSLSASLTDPSMIEFISDWILGEERDCILLIEDAEPLLEVRGGSDGRSIGISNLLNMTDGLLNDILGLTVIATFNTPLSKIDPALLRPQRLVARKEFRKLSKDQLGKLSEALEIELPDIKYPASLAEFYASKNQTEVLVHDLVP